MKRLANKVVLVTGGSRGMGAAIVRKLAGEGAKIAFTYAGSAEKAAALAAEVKAGGQEALAIQADNRQPAAVVAAVDKTLAAFGRLDILVNNAGIYFEKPLEACTMEDYDRMMDINTRAVFVASQAAARHMESGGRIITIGSNMAAYAGSPNVSLYVMSKAALVGLNKGMARDLGPRGITVNLVQPGPTDTDMNPASGAHAPALVQKMPAGRYGHVSEIAALVAYLAGSESGFMTGEALTIDGGFNS